MTSQQEALARIAALCEHPHPYDRLYANEVRAILAEVSPEVAPDYAAVNRSLLRRLQDAGGVLDRDRAGDVLGDLFDWCEAQAAGTVFDLTYWLDRLAAAVRPATIDRDALTTAIPQAILDSGGEAVYGAVDWGGVADAILALVRPVAIIDRDALRLQVWKAVTRSGGEVRDEWLDYATDAILALVRPVAGGSDAEK